MTPWRRSTVKHLLEDTDTRLEQAKAALEEAEQTKEKVNSQVSLLQGLRSRWDKVHEKNHLAEIFAKDGGLG